VFRDIRLRFPHYKIAIFYISASENTIRDRIRKRAEETGRDIPETQIVRSLVSPEKSIRMLAPLSDLVIRIENEAHIRLVSVEDYSGNWRRGLESHFGSIQRASLTFPEALGPLYLEHTAFRNHPFIKVENSSSNILSAHVTYEGLLTLKVMFRCCYCLRFIFHFAA
jgi:hypothetical protein